MLWWYLILGASAVVVVVVGMLLYVQVRKQMKHPAAGTPPQLDDHSQPPTTEG
jgi:hypothetical protein